MNLVKSTVLTFATQLVLFFLGLFTSILVVKTIGAQGRGVIELLNNFFSILVSIFSFSLHSSIVYYINKTHSRSKYFSTLIIYSLVMCIILIVVLYYIQDAILNSILRNITLNQYCLSFFLIISYFFERSLIGYSRAINDVRSFNINQIARKLLYLSLILIIIIKKPHESINWIFSSLIISHLVLNISLLIRYKNQLSFSKFSFDAFKELFQFGIKEHIGVISQKLNLRFDILIIGMFLSVDDIGYYSIAVLFSEFIWYFTDALGVFLFPKITLTSDPITQINYISKVNRLNFYLTLLIAVFVIVLGIIFIPILYGSEFEITRVPFLILVVGTSSLTLAKIITKYFSGAGIPQYSSLSTIIGLIINIPLLFILIPIYGSIGAAIATTISYMTVSMSSLIIFRNICKKLEISTNLIILNTGDFEYIKSHIKPLKDKLRWKVKK